MFREIIPSWFVERMGRISYSKKFFLHFIALTIPLMFAMSLIVIDVHTNLKQNQLEQQAIDSFLHTSELLMYAQIHRGLNQSYLRGYDDFTEQVQETQQAVDEKISDIDSKREQWPAFFHAEKWDQIKAQWHRVKEENHLLKSYYIHNQLNEEILIFVNEIGEQARIYLNPDAKMNRLSSVLNGDLLLATEALGKLRAYATSLSFADTRTPEQQEELAIMIGGAQFFVQSVAVRNPDLNGETKLDVELEQFTTSAKQFLRLIKADELSAIGPEGVFSSGSNAITSGFTLYEKGNGILLEHLQEKEKQSRLLIGLVVVSFLCSIGMVCLLFGSSYVSVMQTIQALNKGTRRWIDGDFSSRVEIKTQDELKYIGDSFNQIAHSFEQKIKEQEQANERIYALAFTDQLTQLPNNHQLQLIVERDMEAGMKQATILRLDIGRFKNVNYSRGFQIGDETLKQFARRLQEVLGEEEVLSRQNGDKFTLYLPHQADVEQVNEKIERILEQLKKPFDISGFTFYLSIRIGLSQYPKDGQTFTALMQQAEEAMYEAKEDKEKQYVYYHDGIHQGFKQEYELENNLRVALANNELFLTYQPKQNVKTGEITGMEALVRWKHPTIGIISPLNFIPIAEKTGLIYQIGEWVLHEACRQTKQWQVEGFQPLVVSVNLSANQFNRKDYLLPLIDRILAETGLDPTYLQLELTESGFQDPVLVKPILEQMKERRLTISIDDFGTGYSSLSYLKQFPIDVVKIDRAFIREICENKGDQQLTKSMIDLGHVLGMKVIAEGVEEIEQIELLRELGCDEVQGFFIAKPLTNEEFIEFLRK
ncbi:EAL domain-containing protein [Halalkalibacter krulwichiae]|uniref:Cyclic di-GMP phosphodiesterase Gmr n=1 Tax=Halalkalibacter krulwichiae TaxID=199441 RepID=A0A1X9MHV1_9BACI|nr:EAL domain-containing protein [Halalkalibacter krulwichiae]ARK32274.1 Cyclic di-GMP phosphodiesterase Gmr [Halalkalibacter krulwichiae]